MFNPFREGQSWMEGEEGKGQCPLSMLGAEQELKWADQGRERRENRADLRICFEFRSELRKKRVGPAPLKSKEAHMEMEWWWWCRGHPRGGSCHLPAFSVGFFLNWTRGRNFPVTYLPSGCGRCLASSPSAKEVLENREGFFPVLFQERGKKGICVCFCVRACSLQ